MRAVTNTLRIRTRADRSERVTSRETLFSVRNKSPPPAALPRGAVGGGRTFGIIVLFATAVVSRSSCDPLGEIKFSEKSRYTAATGCRMPAVLLVAVLLRLRDVMASQPRRFEKRFRPTLGHVYG